MQKETERKFLISGQPWAGHQGVLIRQAYLMRADDRILRIRQKGDHFFLTLKIGTGMTRLEFERDVTEMEGEALLNYHALESPIQKMRYDIPFVDHKWEVDVFWGDNAELVMAEVELGSEDETFVKPVWCGAEVTDDLRYQNSYIAQNPYNTWE